jgi:deoxyribonuclease IV
MTHKIGAHVSIEGGYSNALKKIHAMGGNTVQIFCASPRIWTFAKVDDATAEEFIKVKQELGIDPVYFHASYLMNLADNARVGKLSTQLLSHELKIASKMGVRGSIIHLGSYKDTTPDPTILYKNIAAVLEKIPDDVMFLIENAGNRKIGKDLNEIGEILKNVKDDRLRVCLDTCHLHAAGYDLRTEKQFDEFVEMFDEIIGMDKLEVWHINDSRDELGSLRDRHENIGEGNVGIEVFRNIVNHKSTRYIPGLLEVPGFKQEGPDKENIDIIKALIQ